MQRLLKYFVQQSHKIYMDYLNSRRCELKLEEQTAGAPDEVRTFNLRLLEETLTLQRHSVVSSNNGEDVSGDAMQNMPKESIADSSKGSKKVTGGKTTDKHSSEFYQVFLSNKLGEKIQVAMLAKNKQCPEDELPPHLDQVEQRLLKGEEFYQSLQYFATES